MFFKDWMLDVCEGFSLHRQTFYLSVDYLDRFLGNISDVQRKDLQLITISCIFVATKLEEYYGTSIDNLANCTGM